MGTPGGTRTVMGSFQRDDLDKILIEQSITSFPALTLLSPSFQIVRTVPELLLRSSGLKR